MKNFLLIDDHEIVRTGLKTFLKNLLGEVSVDDAYDGESAMKKVNKSAYDLVIMDVNIPGTDSPRMISNILAVRPATNILMFSMNAEEVYAKNYLKLGVKGYVSKTAPENQLALAIITVLQNKRYISPELSESLLNDIIDHRSGKNPFKELSGREFEILQHIIRGNTNTQIARDLNVQPATISSHKTKIFEKLNCKNIIDLTRLAKLHKLLPG